MSEPSTVTRLDTRLRSGLVTVGGHEAYAVAELDRIDPFLIGMVSDGDRWAFVSSNGPLAAGRRNADESLFPYETDDRLHRNSGVTGPVTQIAVRRPNATHETYWQPFGLERTSPGRWLAKSVVGDAVTFGDHDSETGLGFEWTWTSSESFGFIRSATLTNTAAEAQTIDVIDGLVGIMPAGLPAAIYQKVSNLSNAYRRSELVDDDGFPMAVYSLEAPVSDRADPEEVLRANVVWHTGLAGSTVSVNPAALRKFRERGEGYDVPDRLLTGRPGAYLVRNTVELPPGGSVSWQIVADVALSHAEVVALRERLGNSTDLPGQLVDSSQRNHDHLKRLMAVADSQQIGSDGIVTAHHTSNVTYNVLRGGVPITGYRISVDDLATFLETHNRAVFGRSHNWLASLGPTVDRRVLIESTRHRDDPDLERLCLQYLPFSFGRRHGDPSRPWNKFDIRVRDEAGNPVVHYEGNWRDVFQNWEALCVSFPEYLPGVIALFLNASTADGYNAYRIGRDGVDWEVPDPDDPWSNIGYWGDHQIVYLLRLLRQCDRLLPGSLDDYLTLPIFAFADVPYQIVGYDEMVSEPRATIKYDRERAAAVAHRVDALGADGKLLPDGSGGVVHASLIEKLLVTALAKLVNFVPDAGIWMNTQRPEWNDANNALVGYGASMVTLIHLRDFLGYIGDLVRRPPVSDQPISISATIADWFDSVSAVFDTDAVSDVDASKRRALMERLGEVGTTYRAALRAHGLTGDRRPLSPERIAAFCASCQQHLDRTVGSNWRDDGLMHSYNLLSFDDDTVNIKRLPLMLEGQVAAISAAPLDDRRRAELVESLFESDLYRADQDSFVLLATEPLPPFLHRNIIPDDAEPLADVLVVGERSLVVRDERGDVRFDADITNAAVLDDRLRLIGEEDDAASAAMVSEYGDALRELFERTFKHHAYLGRSGSMYAYEGIGSIYWHMVTKLQLAVQEAALDAAGRVGSDAPVVHRLVDGYRRIRDGLGFRKSATEFGAIPIDPYSHTPSHSGAQQPGMTGAVKEELLARWAEVGIGFGGGQLSFDPLFINPDELLEQPRTWVVDVGLPGTETALAAIDVPARSVGATLCQVPVIVTVDDSVPPTVTYELKDGSTKTLGGGRLDEDATRQIFARSGRVVAVRAVVGSRDSGT